LRYDVATKITAANKAEKIRRRRVSVDDALRDFIVVITPLLNLQNIITLNNYHVNNYIAYNGKMHPVEKRYFDKSEKNLKKLLQFIKRCDIILKSE
jgi:hypothetical protein